MSNSKLPAIPDGYDPTKDAGEYMNPLQLAYFRDKLEQYKNELLQTIQPKIDEISDPEFSYGDEGDIASKEMQRLTNLRLTDRQSKLIKKIDEAILRIDAGDYGYCQVTGKEIGIARLLARPMTSLCIEEQERRESEEKVHEQYEDNENILLEGAPEEN